MFASPGHGGDRGKGEGEPHRQYKIRNLSIMSIILNLFSLTSSSLYMKLFLEEIFFIKQFIFYCNFECCYILLVGDFSNSSLLG
jgi:hypothetical protein